MTPAIEAGALLAGRSKAAAKVRLNGERQRYTIQACDDRFIIMTKPFNAQRTYLYTIADLERGVRGPCNLIFGLPCDVNSPAGAGEALSAMQRGEMEVSARRCVDLTKDDAAAISAALRALAATQETPNAE